MKNKFIKLFPWSVALLCGCMAYYWSWEAKRQQAISKDYQIKYIRECDLVKYVTDYQKGVELKYDSVVEVTHKIFFEGSVLPIAITIDDSAIDEVFSDTVGFHLKAKDWDRYYKYTNGSRTNIGRHNIAIGGDINTPLMSGSYNKPIGYQALPKEDYEYVYLPKERHWMKVKKIVVKGLEWHIPIKDTTFPKGNPDTLKKQNT